MRFLCDMGISRKVAEWLRRQGYESSHLGEEGLARLPNGRIFSKARLLKIESSSPVTWILAKLPRWRNAP